MDKAKFYTALRRKDSGVFTTRLSEKQVASIEIILDEGARRKLPLKHLAYVLATPYHEVGSSMQPIVENLNYSTAARIRAVWPTRFRTNAAAQPYVKNPQKLANFVYGGRLGNNTANDGWDYRGRGFPQTTGKENYERSGKIVGVNLVANPDQMLDPKIAAVTMIESMMRGLYTGKKLSDFISDTKADYRGARAIINADVKKNGSKVANYTKAFEAALIEAGYDARTVAEPAAVPVPVPQPRPPVATPSAPVALDDPELVAKVQSLLREKGYPEVGNVDGKFGDRTRNAILAFQADNNLIITGRITQNLLVALLKAPVRQNSIERETATQADLKDAKSVKLGDWIKKIGLGLIASSGLGGVMDGSASFDDLTSSVTSARGLLTALGSVAPWLIGAGVGAVILYFGSQIIREQVEAYRAGRHV